jgi:hypothetical protein
MEPERSLLFFTRAYQSLCLVGIKSIYQLYGLESFLEANRQSARQDIPNFFWNPKIHYGAQDPGMGFYADPDESSKHPHTLFL